MNTRSMSSVCFLALMVLAGCGSSQPSFSNREEFQQLESFAQDHVTQILNQYFGTPTESVVWEKLPIEYHYANSTVSGEPTARKVQFAPETAHASIGPGTEVYFSGAKQSGWISQWDPETQTATLETKLGTIPAVGEAVVVGPGAIIKDGRHLYAQHCQHCHGVSGDGNGPTAKYLNPLPRDYRNGRFKFTTTTYDYGPSRNDLHRVIREGIPGTYMPSFKLLKPQELQAITEYVMWLSMRGEIEKQLITVGLASYKRDAVQQRITGGEKYSAIEAEFKQRESEGELKETFELVVDLMVTRWQDSQLPENMVTVATKRPPATPESIAHGRQLYLDVKNKCASCHGDAGYGDGPQNYSLTEGKPAPGLYDDWNHPIKPRNLHTGIYRGGRRPYDLFCRIRASVKGGPMPKFDTLPEADVWDLVNYVYSIPFEHEAAGTGRVEQVATDAAPADVTPAAATAPESAQEVVVN